MNDFFEQVKLFLPKYLTPERAKDLYLELSRFPNISSFYLSDRDVQDELLQGDAWSGFILLRFADGERKTVKGIIISNSCDISPANTRHVETNVLFAPLIAMADYYTALRASGASEEKIDSLFQDIRKQRITNIFFLPSRGSLFKESLILLDDIHSHPLAHFLRTNRCLLVRLNQVFFYIFLIKLSIHFSRFNENVQRSPSSGSSSMTGFEGPETS